MTTSGRRGEDVVTESSPVFVSLTLSTKERLQLVPQTYGYSRSHVKVMIFLALKAVHLNKHKKYVCEWRGFNLLNKVHCNLNDQTRCEVAACCLLLDQDLGVLSDPTAALNGSFMVLLTGLSTLHRYGPAPCY